VFKVVPSCYLASYVPVFESDRNMKEHAEKPKKIALFGHFDATNLGNESTLQAILHHLRCYQPDAEVTCISTGSEAIGARHQIEAIPISKNLVKSWSPQSRLPRLMRTVAIGIPSELYRCIAGLVRLRRKDALIVAGTGLLTDAYGLFGWGPYNLFKWSLIAKLCRCKLFFVSVGAGPIDSAAGRWLVKSALSLADFRSYRDNSSVKCLHSIGFLTEDDRVCPDLAFSLPTEAHTLTERRQQTVVGLGLMAYSGQYKKVPSDEQNSILEHTDASYPAYLESLADFAGWLLGRKNDVRLLIGDHADIRTRQQFASLLRKRPSVSREAHVIDESILSVDDLLSQIAATDIVVATRFHNVLLALLCGKPVISISFHHKCASLMTAMGLSSYCLDINELKTDKLIETFCDVELNADRLRALIRGKVEEFREVLDEQYRFIFNDVWLGASNARTPPEDN
jgi:polysaccharide pyruvyl transferase WcaK-like protein